MNWGSRQKILAGREIARPWRRRRRWPWAELRLPSGASWELVTISGLWGLVGVSKDTQHQDTCSGQRIRAPLRACAEGSVPSQGGWRPWYPAEALSGRQVGWTCGLVPNLGRAVKAGCVLVAWHHTGTVWFGPGKLVLLRAVSLGKVVEQGRPTLGDGPR